MQPGEVLVLTLTSPRGVAALHVHAFDHDIPPFPAGDRTWKAIVGIDLDVKPGSYAILVDTGTAPGEARTIHHVTVRPKQFPTRRLTVDEAFVNPPEAVQNRIQEEARLLEALWSASASSRLWDGAFARPVPQPANSAFGSRSIFNGQPRSPHGGADFPSPTGTPVAAPNSGRVVLAKDLYYTGNTVVIDHGLGLVSLFAHLSAMNVREGDAVAKGQILGLVGATGRVTGPHLHWTLRANGARVDPLSLLAVLG